MADVSKLKKAGRLGPPPAAEEASRNLAAPEIAPAAAAIPPSEYRRRDFRSARKTNRVIPFATRVSPEYDQRLRDIAERDNLKLAELLELSLDAYEAQHNA